MLKRWIIVALLKVQYPSPFVYSHLGLVSVSWSFTTHARGFFLKERLNVYWESLPAFILKFRLFTKKSWYAVTLKNTQSFSYCPLLQHLYSLFVWVLHFSACLFKAQLLKSPGCSDWSALTGLSGHCPECLCIITLLVFLLRAVSE